MTTTNTTSARWVKSVGVTSPHCHVHEEDEEMDVDGLCCDCAINKPHKLYTYYNNGEGKAYQKRGRK